MNCAKDEKKINVTALPSHCCGYIIKTNYFIKAEVLFKKVDVGYITCSLL